MSVSGEGNTACTFNETGRLEQYLRYFKRTLGLLILLLLAGCAGIFAAAPQDSVYVVAYTAHNRKEALQKAEFLQEKGFLCEVRQVPLNKYVVTVGRVPYKNAKKLKEKVVKAGLEFKYAYISTGEDFEGRIFPRPPEPEAELLTSLPPPTAGNGMYIIISSGKSRESAIKLADSYLQQGYPGEVFLSSNQFYIVSLGRYPREQAARLKDEAVQKGIVRSDAYLSSGAALREKIYPPGALSPQPQGTSPATGDNSALAPAAKSAPASPPQSPAATTIKYESDGNRTYVLAGYSNSMDEAVRQAEALFDKGYSSEVYWTSNGNYVTVLGPYSPEKARQIRDEAVQKGILKETATLSGEKLFRERIYSSENQRRYTVSPSGEPSSESPQKNGQTAGQKTAPDTAAATFGGSFFIVARESNSEEEAVKIARALGQKKYDSKVYQTAKQHFAITLGYYPREEAERLKNEAMRNGDADRNAWLSSGKEFTRQVYPAP